jgi:hypothetical protein
VGDIRTAARTQQNPADTMPRTAEKQRSLQ